MALNLGVVVSLLLLSGLFSASELAIMGTPLYKIKQLAKENKRYGKLLLKLRKNSNKTLVAILLGNNFVNVYLSVYASSLGNEMLSSLAVQSGVLMIVISFSITALILLFGEIFPKAIATKVSLQSAQLLAPIINLVIYVTYPIVYMLAGLLNVLNYIFGSDVKGVSRKDVEIFVQEGEKQGIFNHTESKIIDSLLDFKFRDIESISKHRTELFALENNISLSEALEKVLEQNYSRVPVYQDNKDSIVGFLTVRKMLEWSQDPNNISKKLKDFDLLEIFKVPLTANLFDIFVKMKKMGLHFAIVVDEYGGTFGFVSLEDILEELVGDIKDETDTQEEECLQKIDDTTLIVKGNVLLREIVDVLDIDNFVIPSKYERIISENDMISSIILKMLSRFAKKGDTVHFANLKCEIEKIAPSKKQILKVKVSYLKDQNQD